MNEVARLFGQGATYDAVEGQLRKAKKAAAALKEEAASRSGPLSTPSRAKKTKNVKDSPLQTSLLRLPQCLLTISAGIKGGRVSKQKKVATSKVKTESLQEDSMLFNAAVNGTGSEETEDEI
jgi:hypothetical protein